MCCVFFINPTFSFSYKYSIDVWDANTSLVFCVSEHCRSKHPAKQEMLVLHGHENNWLQQLFFFLFILQRSSLRSVLLYSFILFRCSLRSRLFLSGLMCPDTHRNQGKLLSLTIINSTCPYFGENFVYCIYGSQKEINT